MIGEADELATFTYRFYSRLDDWKRGKYHYPQLCPKDWECSVAQKSQIGPCRSQKKIHEVKIEIDSPESILPTAPCKVAQVDEAGAESEIIEGM
jgi:hypothetical protein